MLQGAGEGRLLVLNNQSSISRVVALKPRQVLLAEQQKRLKMPKTVVLEDDHKRALLHSVVKYMSNKGFKKSLKKFVKEAQVEDGAWEANSFDLEEIYCKYLGNCKNGDTNTKDLKEPEKSAEGTLLKDADGDKGTSLDAVNKKKKKKNEKNGDITKSSVSEVISDNAVEELKEKKKKTKNAAGDEEAPVEDDGKNTNNTNEENNKDDVTELTSKKKKKKNKLTFESREENGTKEVSLPAVSEKQVVPKEGADVAEITADQNNSEPKEKKRKKKVSGKPLDNGVELVNKEQSQDDLDNGTDEKSKKRKRSTSDESEDKQVEGVVTEDSKRRKTEAVNAQQTEVKIVSGESKEDLKSPNPSFKKKTVNKQQNGSIEPKTVNAFQRVKVDAVKFSDERLTDNSYWAKDGAETGYGAKAQEILGQVKGRDFRHEKTKKKRGSYRGGQIDLQSHSVKFNYSDEE